VKRTIALLVISASACGDSDSGPRDAAVVVDAHSDAPMTQDDAPPDAALPVFRIEEVLVGVAVQPSTREFVEISGVPGVSLDGISIRVISADGTSPAKRTYALSMTAGTMVPADGRWVIGGALVTGVDRILSITSSGDDWDLDNTAGAIQLLRMGTPPMLVDVIGYGAAVTPDGSLSAPTTTAEGTPAALPTDAIESMGRRASSVDSDNNMADFCVQAESSGKANTACL